MTHCVAQIGHTVSARMLFSPTSSSVSASLPRSQPSLGFSRALQVDTTALRHCIGAGVVSKAARAIRHPIKALASGPMGAATGTSKPPPGPWELLNPSEYSVEPGSMQDKVCSAAARQL